MIRCNNKQMLLKRDAVKLMLLKAFGQFQERIGFKVYGFVIMDNHAHFLLQVRGE
jgi:REP element-mobilizing transposase RayT